MSPAEYLSSLTYKHPWASAAHAVVLDTWWLRMASRKYPTAQEEK